MKFGVTVVPRISDWQLFVDLETMGYDAAWAANSQMLYSDAYAVLALAAANTSRIRLGTGVVGGAACRLAPVTAHSIATINQLAPGRTFLGIGTGHTAMRVMGKDPVKARRVPRVPARAARAAARRGGRLCAATARRQRHPFPASRPGLHRRRASGADLCRRRRSAGAEDRRRLRRRPRLLAQPDPRRLQKSLETMQRGRQRRRPHLARRLPHRCAELCLRAAARRKHDLRPGDRRDRPDGGRDAALLVGALPEGRRHQHGRPALPQPVGRVSRLHREDGDAARPSATSRSISATAPSCRRRSAASSPRT